MKKSIVITFIIALFSVVNSNAQEASTDKFTVEINGMGCPYCASGIENEFRKLDDISDIKIDINTGTLSFLYPTEANLSLEKVEAKVTEAGYTPVTAKVERANGKTETSKKENGVVKAQMPVETKSFLVAGNCEMCKARIDKAAKAVPGVLEASWNVETKKLTVKLNAVKTSQKEIQKAVAGVGHDTKMFKAESKTYNNLHACCQYERLK